MTYPYSYVPMHLRLAGNDSPRAADYYVFAVPDPDAPPEVTGRFRAVSPLASALATVLEQQPPRADMVIMVLFKEGGGPHLLYRWLGDRWILNPDAAAARPALAPANNKLLAEG